MRIRPSKTILEALAGNCRKPCESGASFLFCGNFHIAHQVTDASPRHHKTEVRVLPHERAWMDKVVDEWGYIDAFRKVNRDKKQYTRWPEWAEGWRKQAGWRVDFAQIATPGLKTVSDDA